MQEAIRWLLQTAAGIVAGLATKFLVDKFMKPKSGPSVPRKPLAHYLGWIAGILIGVVVFMMVAGVVNRPPNVSITSPAANATVDGRKDATGSVSFNVMGSSARVFSDQTLALYVLVHPVNPPAAGWWVQHPPATVDPNGEWSAVAWHGGETFRPESGHRIEILALVAKRATVGDQKQVGFPGALEPVAQSPRVSVTIGLIK